MISYHEEHNGWKYTVFQPDDKDEIAAIKSWLRMNLGRSHGPWHGAWWPRSKPAMNARDKNKTEIVVLPGPHNVLVQLTWS